MSIAKLTESLQARHRAIQGEFCGLNAALAIAQMDPHSLDDLVCYLRDLEQAQRTENEEAQEYLVEAIAEVFTRVEVSAAGDIASWEAAVAASPDGQAAVHQVEADAKRFLEKYRELKSRSGLRTQREVAAACGLSLTTVNAIEQGAVRPHFKTLEKLAAGFNTALPDRERVTGADLAPR
jgi:DNA-binding XRE family transcriptional regulator